MLWTVIPTRTTEYLVNALGSMEAMEPGSSASCVVVDTGMQTVPPMAATRIVDPQPFVFARAINRGVAACPPEADLLVLNDDAAMLTPLWRLTIERLLEYPDYRHVGLFSLAVRGGVGNPDQEERHSEDQCGVSLTTKTVCFVAAVIRRRAWDLVGPLDERFVAYGFDDDDYCTRLRAAAFGVGVTQRVVVQHGLAGMPHSSSYGRYFGRTEYEQMFYANQAIYLKKWGRPPA